VINVRDIVCLSFKTLAPGKITGRKTGRHSKKSTAKIGCATKANGRCKERGGRAEARPYKTLYKKLYKSMPIFRE